MLVRDFQLSWSTECRLYIAQTVLPCSLTFLPVVAFDIDTEDGDLLPFGLVLIEVYVGDGDAPGRQVPLGAWCAGRLSGGIVLHHNSRLLHLQERTQPKQGTKNSEKSHLDLKTQTWWGDITVKCRWVILGQLHFYNITMVTHLCFTKHTKPVGV